MTEKQVTDIERIKSILRKRKAEIRKKFKADILSAINLIESFVKNMDHEEFMNDAKTQSSVIRQFEIIGEVVKKLDPALTQGYTEIDWSAIAGM